MLAPRGRATGRRPLRTSKSDGGRPTPYASLPSLLRDGAGVSLVRPTDRSTPAGARPWSARPGSRAADAPPDPLRALLRCLAAALSITHATPLPTRSTKSWGAIPGVEGGQIAVLRLRAVNYRAIVTLYSVRAPSIRQPHSEGPFPMAYGRLKGSVRHQRFLRVGSGIWWSEGPNPTEGERHDPE